MKKGSYKKVAINVYLSAFEKSTLRKNKNGQKHSQASHTKALPYAEPA